TRRAARWAGPGRTPAARAGAASASAARARAPPPSRRAAPPPPCSDAPRASGRRSGASPATPRRSRHPGRPAPPPPCGSRCRPCRSRPGRWRRRCRCRWPACRSPRIAPGRGRGVAGCEWPTSRALLLGFVRAVEQHALAVALLLVELARGDQVLRQLGEAPLAHARRAGLGPAPEHLVLERALHLPGAEDLLHLAHDQLEHADLAVEDLEHVRLDRP